jgi:acyl carrier protein
MTLQQNISEAIARALDEVNTQLPPSQRLDKKPSTVLFGREQGLDSLGLVNLIVALEKHVEASVGRTVSLSSPEVILAADSPFASVASLEAYLASLLQKD